MDTFQTESASLLRGALSHDPLRAAYLLGDLQPPYFEQSRWFVASYRDRVQAVVLSFEALSVPAVLTFGAPDGVADILTRFHDTLPVRCNGKVPLDHESAFASAYDIQRSEILWTMGLQREHFRAAETTTGVVRLGSADVPQMLALYAQNPGNFFEPEQLPHQQYFGRYVNAELVSIAGTHIFAPGENIAVLGNIVTSPAHRNQGHAFATTTELVASLHANGCGLIALQVANSNTPALSTYRRLGFLFNDSVLQVECRRR